jgi:hypothetical protein
VQLSMSIAFLCQGTYLPDPPVHLILANAALVCEPNEFPTTGTPSQCRLRMQDDWR